MTTTPHTDVTGADAEPEVDETDITVMDPSATFEGRQEMRSRSEISATQLLRESGAVLRLSEAAAAELSQSTAGSED